MRPLCGTLVFLLASVTTFAAAPPTPALDADGDPLPHAASARLGTSRWRLGVPIHDLAYSPDGKWLASADGLQHTARLWDAATGKRLRTFTGHREGVVSVAFSRDGKRLLTASQDKTVRIWDVATGEQRQKITLEMVPRHAGLAVTDKGFTVLDTSLRVLRFDHDGKELGRAKVSTVFHVSLSTGGGHVLTALAGVRQGTRDLRITNAEGKLVCNLDCDHFGTAILSPDGKRVAVRPLKGGITLYDGETGKETSSLSVQEANNPHGELAFSPDGKRLVAAVENNKLRAWDVKTGKRLVEFAGDVANARTLAFSRDGKRLALASHLWVIQVFDVEKGTRIDPDEIDGDLHAVAFSADGRYLIAGGVGTAVRVWEVKTRRLVRRLTSNDLQLPGAFYGVALSADGKRAAAVGLIHPAIAWDVASGKEVRRLTERQPLGFALLSADGQTLFAGGMIDHAVHRWDLKTGEKLSVLKPQKPANLRSLQLSASGKTLTAHAFFGSTSWDVGSGKEERSLAASSIDQRLSSDGKTLVALDRGNVCFLDVKDSKMGVSWPTLGSKVRLSPDDKSVATLSQRLLCFHKADGASAGPVVFDHANFVAQPHSPFAFSPDGKRLAVCFASSVLLYDVATLRNPPVRRLSAGEWNWCWDVLSAALEYQTLEAQALLQASRGTWVEAARKELTPPTVDAKRVAKLLDAVVGEDKEEADKAVDELVKLGRGVRPFIDRALQADPDADARLKLQLARSKMPGPDANEEALRAPRVVRLLRGLGTPEAKALLSDATADTFGATWQKAAKGKG